MKHPSNAASGQVSVTFMILTLLFCVCLIVSNLMEIKTVPLGPLTITAGVVLFPVSYIINDCIVELYGYRRARLVIWLGFAMNLLVSLSLQLGILLPGDESWTGQQAMVTVYGAVPRILAASFTAFVCGSLVNARVMEAMRLRAGRDRGFGLRAIVSTLLGEGVDSLIFFPIAFGGVLPATTVLTLILTQTLLKTAYEIIVLPLTVTVVRTLRQIDTTTSVTA